MNNASKALLGAFLLQLITATSARALPAYRRLWEGTYKYKMSCAICHVSGGGSERTGYGKDFQRYGATPAAFKAIEKRDSDGDGFSNIEEIKARSNPGDPNSTPANPTAWLGKIEEAMLPLKQLEELFPGIKKFSALEGALPDKQLRQVEQSLAKKLTADDAVPTFYFAVQEEQGKLKRTGVSLFVTPAEGGGELIVAVGMDLSGKITKVLLVKNEVSGKLDDQAFLGQFTGKSVNEPLEMGKDIRPVPKLETQSALVAQAVKKALLIIQAVFSKK